MSGGVTAATVATYVGTAATVLGAIKSLTAKGPGAPPALEKPTVMPTADDDAAKKARRKAIAEQQARSGRLSTILSNDDALGA